jgi:hypothetical protein
MGFRVIKMLKLIFITKVIGNFIGDEHCTAAGGLTEHALSPLCPLRHHQPRFLGKTEIHYRS